MDTLHSHDHPPPQLARRGGRGSPRADAHRVHGALVQTSFPERDFQPTKFTSSGSIPRELPDNQPESLQPHLNQTLPISSPCRSDLPFLKRPKTSWKWDHPESLFRGQILSFIVVSLRPVRVMGVPEVPSHRTQGPRVDHRMEGPQMP